MFAFFKYLNYLKEALNQRDEALIRAYESEIGFLKSSLEYERQKNDDLLNLLHRQAGLIQDKIETRVPSESDYSAIQSSNRPWSETRRRIEDEHRKDPKLEEHLKYIRDNESVIAGEYRPSTDN